MALPSHMVLALRPMGYSERVLMGLLSVDCNAELYTMFALSRPMRLAPDTG